MERAAARVIAGGSNAEGRDQAGGVSSGPPCRSITQIGRQARALA